MSRQAKNRTLVFLLNLRKPNFDNNDCAHMVIYFASYMGSYLVSGFHIGRGTSSDAHIILVC